MAATKPELVTSGMRPSGSFHLGNYFGALKNWVDLQDQYECLFFIVDWHALTDNTDTADLPDEIRRMAIDWIACGLDPEKCSIFVQSEIKELAELYLLLSMITPVSALESLPTYQERVREQHIQSPGYGLLGYPVLMTADVIIYGGTLVPVGEDQTPHIRLMQRTAERFNRTFNQEVFRIPRILLTPEARVPGVDWRKMSKSYGNAIDIADSEDDTIRKVRTMFTDPSKLHLGDPGRPVRLLGPRRSEDERIAETDLRTQTELVEYNPGCVAYYMHRIFTPDQAGEVRATCEDGSRMCVPCKSELAEKINAYLRPIRQRRAELEQQPEYIDRVLAEGAEKARELARRTMAEARSAMRLHYRSA